MKLDDSKLTFCLLARIAHNFPFQAPPLVNKHPAHTYSPLQHSNPRIVHTAFRHDYDHVFSLNSFAFHVGVCTLWVLFYRYISLLLLFQANI